MKKIYMERTLEYLSDVSTRRAGRIMSRGTLEQTESGTAYLKIEEAEDEGRAT